MIPARLTGAVLDSPFQLIVLSGGIAEAGEAYFERVRAAYNKYTWTKFPNPVRPPVRDF